MTTLSKTLIAAAAFAARCDLRLFASSLGIQSGHGLHGRRPGKMSAMAMASSPKNHDAMMKNAQKVPEQHRVLHGQWRALLDLGYARPHRQFPSPLILGR